MRTVLAMLVIAALPAVSRGSGAWVPPPGHGDLNLGFSEKMAHTSYDIHGNLYTNTTIVNGQRRPTFHDFRYVYLSGEVGLFKNVSFRGLFTHLYGLEGPKSDQYKNVGLSDFWIGFKYGLRQNTSLPMAFGLTARLPYFYDLPGPYNRFLFDTNGDVVGNNPEWRGLLKRDLTLTYLISHSFLKGRGWASLEAGYTWREGAPADQIPVWAEVGLPLPLWNAAFKTSVTFVRSRYNQSVPQPDDRFRPGAINNFNEASMLRLAGSFWVPFGPHWYAELGYGQWVWGRSARRYKEPFVSIGYRR